MKFNLSLYFIVSILFIFKGAPVVYAQQYIDDYIIPKKIGIYFSNNAHKQKKPNIILTAFAGNGCDHASELDIKLNLISNQPNIRTMGGEIDILEVMIDGYELIKFNETDNSDVSCIAMLVESRANIDLSKFMTKNALQINFYLNNTENIYTTTFHNNITYLNPDNALNVISWNPSENMPDKPQHLGYMNNDFLRNLARVKLNGTYALKSDLAGKIRPFINEKGFSPLDEIIAGYPQMNPLEDMIVYIRDEFEINEFEIIGSVAFTEIIGGKKTIDVGITKVSVNPYFVRYSLADTYPNTH